jgi:hypothetical protein
MPYMATTRSADRASVMLWTFGKEKERISLGRKPDACVLVVVRGRDQLREYRFTDMPRLRVFQADMEAFLHRTGWSLLKYHPERRQRERDRRRFPRIEERRRWWTGPRATERDKAVWGGKPASV